MYFASDVLARWVARGGVTALTIRLLLAALVALVCAAFTYGIGLWNLTPPGEMPGIEWDRTVLR